MVNAQDEKYESVFIEGWVKKIDKSAGDISFYSWQLYITLDSARFVDDDSFDYQSIVEYCDSINIEKSITKFECGNFAFKKDIDKYLRNRGFIKKGTKVRIEVPKKELLKAIEEKYTCSLFYTYSIRRIWRFSK